MTLPSLATVEQLEDRLNLDLSDLVAQAQMMLDYASNRIRRYTGCTWVDDEGALVGVPDGVDLIAVEMVFRAVTNPSGATQDTTGPFSVSFGPEAAQRIFLQRAEREDLDRVRCRSRLSTISTTRGPVETPTFRRFDQFD